MYVEHLERLCGVKKYSLEKVMDSQADGNSKCLSREPELYKWDST